MSRIWGRPAAPTRQHGVVDDLVDAATYESLSGVTKADYEDRLRREVFVQLAEEPVHSTPPGGPDRWVRGSLASYDGAVESVVVEGAGSESSIVVRFRMDERPGRVFARRCRIWPAPRPDAPDDGGTPEKHASVLAWQFDEDIETVWWKYKDRSPDQDGLIWLPDDSADG